MPLPNRQHHRSTIPEFPGVPLDTLLQQRYGDSAISIRASSDRAHIQPLPSHGQDVTMPSPVAFTNPIRPRMRSDSNSTECTAKMSGALNRVETVNRMEGRYPVAVSSEYDRRCAMGSVDDYCPRFTGKAGRLLG